MILTAQARGEQAVNIYVDKFNSLWGWAGAVTPGEVIDAMLEPGETRAQFCTKLGEAINENIGDYQERVVSVMEDLATWSLGRLPKKILKDREAWFSSIEKEKPLKVFKEAATDPLGVLPTWMTYALIFLVVVAIAFLINYIWGTFKNIKQLVKP